MTTLPGSKFVGISQNRQVDPVDKLYKKEINPNDTKLIMMC
jgi:hypothetical protein